MSKHSKACTWHTKLLLNTNNSCLPSGERFAACSPVPTLSDGNRGKTLLIAYHFLSADRPIMREVYEVTVRPKIKAPFLSYHIGDLSITRRYLRKTRTNISHSSLENEIVVQLLQESMEKN